jgi:hypothetical protein
MQTVLNHLVAADLSGPFGDFYAIGNRPGGKPHFQPRHKPGRRKAEICACKMFKRADALWVDMSDAAREPWHQNARARGISGYDLWMKECLWLWHRGLLAPDLPGASGGWQPHSATPG